MKSDKRECLQCGGSITGRLGKKFCSDLCRATANNARKKSDESEVLLRDINQILRHNRSILRQVCPLGDSTVWHQTLEMLNFDFRYFTHLFRTKQGNTYYFCYDYGYSLLDYEKLHIINHQP